MWSIQSHKVFNIEHHLFTPLTAPTMDAATFGLLHENPYFLDKMFMLMSRLNRMELSEEETCLFMALQLLYTGAVLLSFGFSPHFLWSFLIRDKRSD